MVTGRGSAHREELWREVLAVVDPPVHADEAVWGGLVLHAGVVEAGVQHDDGVGEHVGRV